MYQSKKVLLIAALDNERAIGRDGQMPWHLPADLRHFMQTTMGSTLVMGRKTYEAIGRALPGRQNIVVSRQPDLSLSDGAELAGDLETALSMAEHDQIFVIGGGEIYQQSLAWTDELILTWVDTTIENADTYFPPTPLDEWTESGRELLSADSDNRFPMAIIRYRRLKENRPRLV